MPDFTSTIYTYHGLDGEEAPPDTAEPIFHPSVRSIKVVEAFIGCTSLVRVSIPYTVTHIEAFVFMGCVSLIFIRLHPNLVYIGQYAFSSFISLEAVYLPPTINFIFDQALNNCASLRSFPLPHLRRGIFDAEEYISVLEDKSRKN